MISGGKIPMSSTLKPSPKPAIPLVSAMSADVNDFDLCKGLTKEVLRSKLLLLLFVDVWSLYAEWWTVGSGANLTRWDDCYKPKEVSAKFKETSFRLTCKIFPDDGELTRGMCDDWWSDKPDPICNGCVPDWSIIRCCCWCWSCWMICWLCWANWICWCIFPPDFECWIEFMLPGGLKRWLADLQNILWIIWVLCLNEKTLPRVLKIHSSLHLHRELLSVNIQFVIWHQRKTFLRE